MKNYYFMSDLLGFSTSDVKNVTILGLFFVYMDFLYMFVNVLMITEVILHLRLVCLAYLTSMISYCIGNVLIYSYSCDG